MTATQLTTGLLQDGFEAAVARAPEQIAVVCGAAAISYAALEMRANRLAHWLRHQGIGPGDCVALQLPRSVELYQTMLAVLKAGAAYVPIDAETPQDRVAFILEDCAARCLISWDTLPDLSSYPPTRPEPVATPQDLCYVIYTSGTTGRPKGVLIEHRNVAHLLAAEQTLYGIDASDRVLQLASPAFDASVEEIWLTFWHGATLVAAPADLGAVQHCDVTVLSCVPSFLTILEPMPSVRILILGGEVCPPDLVAPWLTPGRRVFNTYGPTETTVIATAAELAAGEPVTIGVPLAGCEVHLLDDALAPMPDGEVGEICIGGGGVGRGYLNRPELDREKFVGGLYRTGDRARRRPDGALEFVGRRDDQIKLRGYRIELGEIEAALQRCPGVRAAAVVVHAASERLAAYVVPLADTPADAHAVKQLLRQQLPPYMVPAIVEIVETLPTGTSGKVDRRLLPSEAPIDAAERTVMAVWEALLEQPVARHDDFFDDLGGHSLLVARVVSKLRQHEGFAHVSFADLYTHRTPAALAELRRDGAAPHAGAFLETPGAVYAACTVGQALGVLFLSGIYAWQWLGAFLAYGYLVVEDWPVGKALAMALLIYAVTTPAMLLLSIAMKWLLLGRIEPGEHPLWGWYYWRFWLVRAVVRACPVAFLAGTPLINTYYRMMGARIGRDVFIGSHDLATFDLLGIGDGSSIGVDTNLDGATIEGGRLRLAPVTIGRGCCVGNRAALGGHCVLEDGSGLDDLSMLPDGAVIPAEARWSGSPAQPAGRMPAETPQRPWSTGTTLCFTLGVFLFPLLVLACIFPGLMLITWMGHEDEGYRFLWAAPLVAASFVLLLCVSMWAAKWLLLGRLRPGRYPLRGAFYWRLWFFEKLMDLSLEVLGTFYTTLYLRPWLQALGARIGPRSEIATIRFLQPDLLQTDAECFLADDVAVGVPSVRGGSITLGSVRLGTRTFVGNSALLPGGATLGDDSLLGTLSVPPSEGAPAGSAWFGSPPMRLPARQRHDGFAEAATYRPPPRLVATRLAIEAVRILLPSTLFVVLASLIVNATDILQDYIELGQWLLMLPFLYLGAGILGVVFTVALKWLLVGRYRPGQKPLWCSFVWRSELVTGVYENLCVAFFLDLLRGTPFLAWALRLLGVKVGQRCYLDTTWITEFDLVEIGDEAALNQDANPQTHLFEDRVMTMAAVRIGRRSTVGSMSTLLYDATVGDAARVGDLSLIMKGETLPAGSRWHGIPACIA